MGTPWFKCLTIFLAGHSFSEDRNCVCLYGICTAGNQPNNWFAEYWKRCSGWMCHCRPGLIRHVSGHDGGGPKPTQGTVLTCCSSDGHGHLISSPVPDAGLLGRSCAKLSLVWSVQTRNRKDARLRGLPDSDLQGFSSLKRMKTVFLILFLSFITLFLL